MTTVVNTKPSLISLGEGLLLKNAVMQYVLNFVDKTENKCYNEHIDDHCAEKT